MSAHTPGRKHALTDKGKRQYLRKAYKPTGIDSIKRCWQWCKTTYRDLSDSTGCKDASNTKWKTVLNRDSPIATSKNYVNDDANAHHNYNTYTHDNNVNDENTNAHQDYRTNNHDNNIYDIDNNAQHANIYHANGNKRGNADYRNDDDDIAENDDVYGHAVSSNGDNSQLAYDYRPADYRNDYNKVKYE